MKRTQYKQIFQIEGNWEWFFSLGDFYLSKYASWGIESIIYNPKTDSTRLTLKRLFKRAKR